MKIADYSILLGTILIAPHVNTVVGCIAGVLLIGIGLYAAIKDI